MINYPPNDVTTLHGQTARDGQAIEATHALAMGRLGCATDGHSELCQDCGCGQPMLGLAGRGEGRLPAIAACSIGGAQ